MLVNTIHTIDDTTSESGEVTEPVTLDEVKDYLRLEGFTADDDSGEGAFDFDDALIEELITEARIWVEKFTGLSLVPKTLTIVLSNQAGMIEFPGPVTGTIVLTDKDDVTIEDTEYKFIGTEFPKLVTRFCDMITAEYDAGYTTATIPKGLKLALLAYCADHYEFRGDDKPEAPNERATQKARPYRRLSAWA